MMFHLCERLGFPHPDYLYPYLSAQQLDDWLHLSHTVGFRDDIQYGFLIALLRNIHRGKGQPSVKPQDVMPYHRTPPASPETIRSIARNASRRSKQMTKDKQFK